MSVKGRLKADHIPTNKYSLAIGGVIPLTIIALSGIEEETDSVDLPDRTTATGGNTKPIEFTCETPSHHIVEQLAWEAWRQEGVDPVSPTYKKTATLTMESGTGGNVQAYTVVGAWVQKRGLPDLSFDSEGEMATTTWTVKADQLIPLG